MSNELATPEMLTDRFISQMIEETGCSIRFLNEAKPILLKLFRDTAGEVRDNCLASVRETIENQAAMERMTDAAAARTRSISLQSGVEVPRMASVVF
jgi:hypothetical protein